MANKAKKEYESSSREAAFVQTGSPSFMPFNLFSKTRSSTLVFVNAEVHGYTFPCRVDDGADHIINSDTIVNFLIEKFVFHFTLTETENFISVDAHELQGAD